jgi:signal transduction histidine kinase
MKTKIFLSHIAIIASIFLFKNKELSVVVTIFSLISLFVSYLKEKKINSLESEKVHKKNQYMIEARDKLLRSVNHELRAPLSRMKMDLEFIESKETRESLNSDIEQMHELVNELMEIEKIKVDGIKKEEVSLTEIIKDLVESLNIDHEKLKFNEKEEYLIEGDSRNLSKLFKNLIENAYKYKSEEGDVTIQLSERGEKKIVTIMNEGSSISGEDLPFIFEPFFRVKGSDERESKDGFGIGLNICKEIIDAHGAKIQVSSKKDHGTTFKITF